jgi:hypothetical protein
MQQSGMNRQGGKILLWLLVLGLMIFTATRTLDFISIMLPPDQQYIGYLALTAFDLGALCWFYFATQSAEGTSQRTVAYGMIFVCGLGVVITTVADMLIGAQRHGINAEPAQFGQLAVWAVIGVIVLNVAGGFLVHLVDPKHQRHMAKENARDMIHQAGLAAIVAKASEIAPRIATRVAQEFEDEVIREMIGHLPPAEQGMAARRLLNTSEAAVPISRSEAERLERRSVPPATGSRQGTVQPSAGADRPGLLKRVASALAGDRTQEAQDPHALGAAQAQEKSKVVPQPAQPSASDGGTRVMLVPRGESSRVAARRRRRLNRLHDHGGVWKARSDALKQQMDALRNGDQEPETEQLEAAPVSGEASSNGIGEQSAKKKS